MHGVEDIRPQDFRGNGAYCLLIQHNLWRCIFNGFFPRVIGYIIWH